MGRVPPLPSCSAGPGFHFWQAAGGQENDEHEHLSSAESEAGEPGSPPVWPEKRGGLSHPRVSGLAAPSVRLLLENLPIRGCSWRALSAAADTEAAWELLSHRKMLFVVFLGNA